MIDGDTVTSENVMEILIGGLPEMNPTYPNEFEFCRLFTLESVFVRMSAKTTFSNVLFYHVQQLVRDYNILVELLVINYYYLIMEQLAPSSDTGGEL